MLLLEGIPVSLGYASGTATVYDYEIERRLELPRRAISHSEVESEFKRLDAALEHSTQDLRLAEQGTLSEPGFAGTAAVLSSHSSMADDIAALVKQHIGREFVNVEQALDSVVLDFVERLQRLDSAYYGEREQDIRDVGRRMMRHLAGWGPWTNRTLPPGSVIVARELLPSETVELANSGMVAIVTEHGGKHSHTAIVAQSLGIPAITGISNVTTQIQPGMRLLVDGQTGRVVVAPSQGAEESFAKRKREYERVAISIADEEKLPCVTQDGIEISLLANIGRPAEVPHVADHNLVGAGLFRTEFLFLESHERPDFQLQSEMYDSMAKGLGGLPLVIRTFDLGGDKLPPFLVLEGSETHASLPLRGLRFSLAEQRLLDTQLHAILHAAQSSDVRILFPMVVGSDDFGRAVAAVDRAAGRLGAPRRPPLGAMIETPAALYALDEILDLADFVTIGTNDLMQYMLAADRDLTEGIDDCTALHPAVLRAIKQVVEAAEGRSCPVCVCGEEASDAGFAGLLVGLGVRELSLNPARAAGVRHSLRRIVCRDASEVAGLALRCRTPQQVRELLEQWQSTETGVSPWHGGEPNGPEPLRLIANGASTRPAAVVIEHDRAPQSPHELGDSSEHRATERTEQLSEANRKLTVAEQDARLAAVAFETYNSIVITDRNGTILRVNRSFTKLTGYTPDDVVGKTPRVLKSGRHGEEFYREMWRTIRAEGHWEGEVWNKRKDGQVYLQQLAIACVKNEFGEITHFVADGRDISERKQSEANRAAIDAARIVQLSLFPLNAPRLPGFDIAGAVHPAETVSGDFYDYFPLGEDCIGVVVADVSGHGFGPALLMAQVQASLHALVEFRKDPGELLKHANRLFASSESGHFVTMFLGRLDAQRRTFVYAGAGHQAYHFRSNGDVKSLEATGLPLGIVDVSTVPSAPSISLEAGDIILLPTDGIEEAFSRDGRVFGQQLMLEVIRTNRVKSASQIVDALYSAAREFAGGEPQRDDITAVVVKVLGPP